MCSCVCEAKWPSTEVHIVSLREVKMNGLAADSKSEEVSYSRQNGSNDPLLL